MNELSVFALFLGLSQFMATQRHSLPLNFPLPFSNTHILEKTLFIQKAASAFWVRMDLDTQTIS